MANIIKGLRFMLGKEESCMWEDTMAVLRAGYWLIALIIVISLLFILTGCESEPTQIILGNPYSSCCNGQIKQLTSEQMMEYNKHMGGRNCTQLYEIGKCPCNTSFIELYAENQTERVEVCDCKNTS